MEMYSKAFGAVVLTGDMQVFHTTSDNSIMDYDPNTGFLTIRGLKKKSRVKLKLGIAPHYFSDDNVHLSLESYNLTSIDIWIGDKLKYIKNEVEEKVSELENELLYPDFDDDFDEDDDIEKEIYDVKYDDIVDMLKNESRIKYLSVE